MLHLRLLALLFVLASLNGCVTAPVPSTTTDTTVSSADPSLGVPPSTSTKLDVISDWSVETDHFVPSTTPRKAGDLWAQLRARYALPAQHQVTIEREARWFAKNPVYLERILKRSRPYLYHIHKKAKEMSVPGEIVLLPVVESAFQPTARSPSSAAGLWQFMPRTGELFGLRQDWWYDGRQDVHASTLAALRYLDNLQKRFDGDWLLALAAYNAGPGTVHRAMQRNRQEQRPVDFWSLRLPAETRAYVPKLLAISRIVANPARYGIKLPAIAELPYFAVVPTGGPIDLVVAAELAGITEAQLRGLNPGFKRWATPPQGPHQLLLPNHRATAFQQGLATLSPQKRLRWSSHQIRKGDSLSKIAKQYGTTITALRKVNSIQGAHIYVGRRLLIPATGLFTRIARSPQTAELKRIAAKTTSVSYTVKSGDTLWNVAKTHQVGLKQLATWNGLPPNTGLALGQRLTIRTNDYHRKSTIHYTVRRGDSLNRISRQFKVSVSDLKRWNPSAIAGKHIHPGQRLKVIVGNRFQGI